MKIQDTWQLLKETLNAWNDDKAQRLGAALAYYAVFSIAPLVIIAIAISGLIFGEQAARGYVATEIQATVGETAAHAIEGMIKNTHNEGTGVLATVLGVVTLLFGSLGVFGQLQDALNTIWKVEPKPGRGWRGVIHDRFGSFLIVLNIGFLLLVSLVISTALAAVGEYSRGFTAGVPGSMYIWQVANGLLSFAVFVVLFGMIYKILPDVKIGWRDVWTGAVVTAILFTLGKYLIGLYLGRAGVTSAFGAAGSLVLILLWVYYSSQVLLFGAEFTRVYADRYGGHILPDDNAVAVTMESRARQGMPRNTDVRVGAQEKPSVRPL